MKIFLSRAGFEPTDPKMLNMKQMCALATAATTSCSKLSKYDWCNFTIDFWQNFERPPQKSTWIYLQFVDLWMSTIHVGIIKKWQIIA